MGPRLPVAPKCLLGTGAADGDNRRERFGKDQPLPGAAATQPGAGAASPRLSSRRGDAIGSFRRERPAGQRLAVRNHLERWRFYHEFPTGPVAPARSPQVGVRTPVLADDVHDLAAAITTIFQIGDGHALGSAVDRAFGGTRVETEAPQGLHALSLSQPGLHRPTTAAELSDGTLRFLYLAAALLTPRPPGLLRWLLARSRRLSRHILECGALQIDRAAEGAPHPSALWPGPQYGMWPWRWRSRSRRCTQ
jgi:hypothetical protein